MMTVRVDGRRQLVRDLRRMGADVADVKDANAAAARIVAAAAAARAPKRTGRLAASVRGSRAVSRATVRAGGAALPYAGPIHYGWPAHNIVGQPFVTDAATETQTQWLPAYQAGIDKALDRIAGHTY